MQHIGWHAEFIAAAFGMLIGLLLLILSKRYFGLYRLNVTSSASVDLNRLSKSLITILCLLVSCTEIYFVLKNLWVDNLLTVVSLISVALFVSIYHRASSEQKKSLLYLGGLTLFAISIADDQPDAKSIVAKLVKDTGFVPVDIGTLAESAPLDPGGILFPQFFKFADMKLAIKRNLEKQ